jgi:dihydrofolate synthase/folylpolyglutamate synthase
MDMPESIESSAREVGARLLINGKDFEAEAEADTSHWRWSSANQNFPGLPVPALPGTHQLQNAAGVIMALELLNGVVPVDESAIRAGLQTVSVTGRQQLIGYQGVQWILDVAHNPHAVAALQKRLHDTPVPGKTYAVLGMLRGKDVAGILELMRDIVQQWHFADIDDDRGLSAKELGNIAAEQFPENTRFGYSSVEGAVNKVLELAVSGDRVVVFGSFVTVSEAFQVFPGILQN